jgi:hypothetical protein
VARCGVEGLLMRADSENNCVGPVMLASDEALAITPPA